MIIVLVVLIVLLIKLILDLAFEIIKNRRRKK